MIWFNGNFLVQRYISDHISIKNCVLCAMAVGYADAQTVTLTRLYC